MNTKVSIWKTAGYGLLFGGIGGSIVPPVYIALNLTLVPFMSSIFNPDFFHDIVGNLIYLPLILVLGIIFGIINGIPVGAIALIVMGIYGFCEGIVLGVLLRRSTQLLFNRSQQRLIWIVNGIIGFGIFFAILYILGADNRGIVSGFMLVSTTTKLGFWMGIVVPAVIAGLWAAIIPFLILDLQKQEIKGAN